MKELSHCLLKDLNSAFDQYVLNGNSRLFFQAKEKALKRVEEGLLQLNGTTHRCPSPDSIKELAYKVDYWRRAHDEVRAEFIKAISTEPEVPKQEPVTWREIHAWMESNMPSGTIISDPSWWAHRIYIRFIRANTQPQCKPLTCFDTEKLAKQCGVEWTTRIDKLCQLAAAHSIKEMK